ncbi:HAMP domain-containing sensor histidine kinase [uncultured Nocardioides sp.]|uniref:sensor histidine kinase n=1 Tax=uncultured Nocardioides sp. TaxID=198441 RepID=UPI002628F77A|nr:HAMP domain-containing sensor histidine kinase [uncultured Nocardioides sp.]
MAALGGPVGPSGFSGLVAKRWHYRRSLASRVTLLTTMAVGLAVAFMALAAFVTVRAQMQSTLDASLLERAGKVSDGRALSELAGATALPPWAQGASDVRIVFVTTDRRATLTDDLGPLPLGGPELSVADRDSSSSVRTVVDSAGERLRIAAVPGGPGEAVVVASSLDPQEQVLSKLALVLGFIGAAGVVAAGLSGWGVARNGLRPVRKLTTSVEDIARTEDLRPLPVEGHDEIARLAAAFNGMLASLGASRDRQRRLVADAGHELRTPLTSLRTNVDLLAQADAAGGLPQQAREELLDDLRAQTEELTTLVGALVELARDEPLPPVVETVDLAEVVDRAVVRVRRRAPDVRFEVSLEPWLVRGESDGLEKAALNLLDNAAKWSPAGGVVHVSLHDGTLRVDDEGPGIAPGDLPHVFERFWRSEESRAMPGSGLGLAIVRQVVDRHSGSTVATESPVGGARLEMSLPGQPG